MKTKYPVIDFHASWLVINSIQGCPKDCKYCFLKPDGLNGVLPEEITNPENAVKELIEYKLYNEKTPICLFPNTDIFATDKNIKYLLETLRELKKKVVKNPIVIITKCKIPEEVLKEIIDTELNIIYFISYSGLDGTIEIGINQEHTKQNFILLKDYDQKVIHYWRPFLPQNSSPEKINEVYDYVKDYASASIVIGLKVKETMIDEYDLSAINLTREEILKADSIFDSKTYSYIQDTLKHRSDYPLFQATSCAISFVLGIPDYKAFYNTKTCEQLNICTEEQRKICSNCKPTLITKENVVLLLKSLDIEVNESNIEIEGDTIYINEINLPFSYKSYLTEQLKKTIVVTRDEADYYWTTSIDSADVKKF